MKLATTCVKQNSRIEYRTIRPLSECSIQTIDHIGKAVILIKETNILDYHAFIDAVKCVYVADDLDVSLNYSHSSKWLMVSLPYFINLGDSSLTSWFEGLTACVMIRIAYLGKLEIDNNTVSNLGYDEVIKLAKERERKFAASLGTKWAEFYRESEDEMLPLIYPVEKPKSG